MLKRTIIISLLASLTFGFSYAQDTDTDDTRTKNPEQNAAWKTGAHAYSAKPKNMWELGLMGGVYNITGDLSPQYVQGYGLGLHLRKAITYSLSVRGDLFYGSATNYDISRIASSTLATEGYRDISDLYGSQSMARNHRTNTFSAGLHFVFNVGNILFHSAENKWNLYVFAGPGIASPEVLIDALDANGQPYNYSSLTSYDVSTFKGKKEYRDAVRAIADGEFETKGKLKRNSATIGDDRLLFMEFQFGLGLTRKISKRVNLGLEYKLAFSGNDLLDGYEFRSTADKTNNGDVQHFANLRLGINLGSFEKRVEPLYWVNPLDAAMNDLAEVKSRPVFDLTDTDGDGVIDLLDQDPNTPQGVAVDVRGIPLDSDGDGIPDYQDKEPFSPTGYEVTSEGVSIVPDSDRPWVTEAKVNEMINSKMANQKMEWWLPSILFDLNKSEIKPEYYSQLHSIAQVAIGQPDYKIKVVGYTDNRGNEEYNKVLSYKRANEAVKYLMERYDLPRDKFILQYEGKDNPIVPGLPAKSNLDSRREAQQKINRRVEFSIATPNDQDYPEPSDSPAKKSNFSGNTNSGM